MYVRTSVAGCPEVRRGVPVDLKKGHIVAVLSYHKPVPGAHGYRVAE